MTEDERDDVSEARLLLPWYVTGALAPEETRLVEAALAEDPLLRAELAEERRLAASIAVEGADQIDAAGLDLIEVSASDENVEDARSASWRTLSTQVQAPLVDRRSPARSPVRTGGWRQAPRRGARMAMLAAAALAAMVAIVVIAPGDDAYETLTDSAAQPLEGPYLRLRSAPGADAAALEAAFADLGLTILDGPSESGVYTLTGPVAAALVTLSARDDVALTLLKETAP